MLPHGDRAEAYGLPANPQLALVKLWRGWFSRSLGIFTILAVLFAAFAHYCFGVSGATCDRAPHHIGGNFLQIGFLSYNNFRHDMHSDSIAATQPVAESAGCSR